MDEKDKQGLIFAAATCFLVLTAFLMGFLIASAIERKHSEEKIRQLELELKYERNHSKALAEDNRWFRKTLWDLRQKLWLESECLNGTIKEYIREIESINDEAMTVNTLVLFYAYNSTINKTKLYWLDPDAEQDEKLLREWGFEVR